MLQLSVAIPSDSVAWARIIVQTKDCVIELPCSDLGGDSLAELAGAFAGMAEADGKKFEVECYGEPQLAIVAVRRRQSEMELTLKMLSDEGDGAPAEVRQRAIWSGRGRPADWKKLQRDRSRSGHQVRLRCGGDFLEVSTGLLGSFQDLLDRLGKQGYERSWGFPCPEHALAAVRAFLSASGSKDS